MLYFWYIGYTIYLNDVLIYTDGILQELYIILGIKRMILRLPQLKNFLKISFFVINFDILMRHFNYGIKYKSDYTKK